MLVCLLSSALDTSIKFAFRKDSRDEPSNCDKKHVGCVDGSPANFSLVLTWLAFALFFPPGI